MDDADYEDHSIRLEPVEHDSVIAGPQPLECIGTCPDGLDVADILAGGQALERLPKPGPDVGGQFREFAGRRRRELN